MKITNRLSLPEALVRAVESHEHKGEFISASQVTVSSREFWLKKRYHDKLEKDVADRVWALFGTMAHAYIEKFATKDEFVEEYMTADVAGKKLSGTMDSYNMKFKKIVDWKTTSVWTKVFGSRQNEWEIQLNMYAYLLRKADFEVNEIEIICFYRDWTESKVEPNSNYPKKPVEKISIKLWSFEEQEKYITDKVKDLLIYENTSDNALPTCTKEQRWATDDKWAVIKDGNKKAMRVLNDKDTAQGFVEMQTENGLKVHIDYRPGSSKKCPKYCSVCSFCNQWKIEQEDK